MDCVDKLTVQRNRWVGHVLLPQGHYGNTFGSGSLDDVTNIISRLSSKWFQKRRFFCFPYIKVRKTCNSREMVTFGPRDVM